MKEIIPKIGMEAEGLPIDEKEMVVGKIIVMTEVYCVLSTFEDEEYVCFWCDMRVGLKTPSKIKI